MMGILLDWLSGGIILLLTWSLARLPMRGAGGGTGNMGCRVGCVGGGNVYVVGTGGVV